MTNNVRKHFDKHSSNYTTNFRKTRTGKSIEFEARCNIVGLLVAGKQGRLLDCACGSGEVFQAALDSGNFDDATLIDISQSMLTLAESRISKADSKQSLNFLCSDIFEHKPNGSTDYDVVLCVGLLAHIGNLDKLLEHLSAQISAGGSLILQSSLYNHIGTKITKAVSDRKFELAHGYSLHYFTEKQILTTCLGHGFELESVTRYCLGVPFGDKLLGAGNYYLEKYLQGVSNVIGSEAIFHLVRKSLV